jgi:hypothetical protein
MNLQTREKISNTLKGKSKSEHHKEKLREAWKHRKKIEPNLDSYIEEKRLEERIKHLPETTQLLIKTIWNIKQDSSLSKLERDKKIIKLLNSVENIARENEVRRYI